MLDLAQESQLEEVDAFTRTQERSIPKDQREKIIFGIDLDLSMDEYFMVGDKLNDTRINRTKQLLKWFIEQKASWNPSHEFAIMILGEMAVWHMDFTTDTVLLSHAIDELYTMGKFKAFDSTTLFKEVLEHADLDQDDGSTIRLIMVYTRSDVLPTIPDPEIIDVLAASGRFSYDCVYIHLKGGEVSGSVKPQHVYDRLTEMEDVRMPGYYYELTRILKKYSSAMGELLAHPSVRNTQDMMNYRMKPPPSVRRMDEISQQQQQLHLDQPSRQQQQLQQQQIYQQHLRQQQLSPTPKRADMAVTYKSSDNLTGGEAAPIASQHSGSFFGSPAPSSTSRSSLPSRLPNSGPLVLPSAHSTSTPSFMSPKERGRTSPSREKIELPSSGTPSRQGSFTASGNGNGSASGSGTGMDDAILI
ncbi:Component of the BRCA1-A complex [Mortierella sp. AM989]|nr:Component of the BRCA1-A complex [Mortierella sp. AM989]